MVSHDAAEASIELAEFAGLKADESQRNTLRAWMGEREDGRWAAFECGHIAPRQVGKGGELEIRQLGGLYVLGEELQLHTAHEFKTANEHFLRMASLIEGCADLRRKVQRIRYANGEQGIELKSGSRLKFLARSGGAGRGFAGASTVYYDESMYLLAQMVGASLPTMSTYWNPQVVYTGSGGFATSSQQWALRKRALSNDGGRLAYLEHTAETVRLVDGQVVSDRDTLDPADRKLWRRANFPLGVRISEEFVESEHRSMPREEFLRERLCVWEPEPDPTERYERVITSGQWLHPDNVYTGQEPARPEAFGVDVSPDRTTAAIGWSGVASDGRRRIGVLEHRPGRGVGWVVEAVAEIRRRSPNAAICVDPRSDVSGLLVELEKVAGELVKTSAQDMAAACGALYDAVVEHRVQYRRQSALEAAVDAAARRPLAGAWAWDRRESLGDITPLVAVTLAHHVHRLVPAGRKPVFW